MPGIGQLFDSMLQSGGSALLLAARETPRIRTLHGLSPLEGQPTIAPETLRQMLKEICQADLWAEYERTGDIDFSLAHGDRARFRVNYYIHHGGCGAVFRSIPFRISMLDELGAPKALYGFAEYPAGLCIIAGPKGSGKSTTLAAIVDQINSQSKRVILTIEDPIEFVHYPKMGTVVQRALRQDVPSWREGMIAAQRQDVDVIMIGNLADGEMATLAMQSAESGNLVLASTSTHGSIKTLERLIGLFAPGQQRVARESLAGALRGISSQVLCRRAENTGRVGAFELLFHSRAVANLIREGKITQLNQVIMSGRAAGMQLLDDHLQQLLDQRVISGDEAYRKAIEKERFARFAPSQET